jgi:hypothetical protein
MSDPTDPTEDSTPGGEQSLEAPAPKKKNLYLRLTSSVPLVVTVIVHVVFILIAGAIVVQQATSEKKRTFEASNLSESSAVQQVEHRLQVARRGGASGGAQSPVSANRIVSSAAGGLALPEMPDLPSMGAGGFGGFGGMGAGVGLGAGTGMATSLGSGTGLGGRGFMSLNFLGSTTQNVSKVIFVVDTSTDIMEPRKGGFQAFTIIREEIMRLVGRLPATAQFNVVLYNYNSGDDQNQVSINLFRNQLAQASTENKNAFFAWMAPVNTRLGSFGPNSAAGRTAWRMQPLPEGSGIDPLILPPVWARAVQPALEQQPDAIYVITATQGRVRRRVDEATLAKRRIEVLREREEFDQAMKREGMEGAAVIAARDAAHRKASAELAAANQRLVAQRKDPIVLRWIGDLERSDVQAELRRNGLNILFDRTGWRRRDGSLISPPRGYISTVEDQTWNDFLAHYARLQRALVPERPALNLFLFVGPNENPAQSVSNLTKIARRNGGSFQLLTTQRLEEIKARSAEEEARQNR